MSNLYGYTMEQVEAWSELEGLKCDDYDNDYEANARAMKEKEVPLNWEPCDCEPCDEPCANKNCLGEEVLLNKVKLYLNLA